MKKRILSILLVAMMIAVLLPMAALADGNVAQVNETGYATLAQAISAAGEGDTVTLLQSVELNSCTVITKGITLDFGEYTVSGVYCTSYPQALFQIKASGKTVTFNGTTGGIEAKAAAYGTRAIAIESGSKLVINGGVYSSVNNCTIYADNAGAELVINGGTINTKLQDPGNFKQSVVINGNLTVTGGTIISELPGTVSGNVLQVKGDNAKVSISGATIKAPNANASAAVVKVESNTATAEIKNCEVTTTSANLANGGNITIGEGTVFKSTSGRVVSGATSAKIEGGSFETSNAFGYSSFPINIEGGSFDVEQLTTNANSTNLKISGGEFDISNATNAEQVLKNYVAPTEEGGEVQVEINEQTYTVNESGEPKVVNFKQDVNGDWIVDSVDALAEFRDKVNAGKSFAGKTVKLTANLDMSGIDWVPIGNVTSYPSVSFAGTFDGGSFTISNLSCTDTTPNYACAGLFGSITKDATVKNLNMVDVDIHSTHYAGAIVAYIGEAGGTIENCSVVGGTITSTPELIGSEYDNGDKVGGINGFNAGTSIDKCAVEDVVITAYRDIGGISGYCSGTVSASSVKNVTIVQDFTNGYKDKEAVEKTVGEIVGSGAAVATVEENGNTAENVETTDDLSYAKDQALAALNQKLLTVESDAAISYINGILYTDKNSIKDAETAAKVQDALANALADIEGFEQKALADAQKAAVAAVNDALGKDYSDAAAAIANTAIAAIGEETSIAKVNIIAEEAIAAIELQLAKDAAVAAVTEALGSEFSVEAQNIALEAIAAVKEASDVDDVNTLMANAVQAIAEQKAADALAAAKTKALADLDAMSAVSDEGKAAIANAKTAVENAATPEEAAAAVTKAQTDAAAADKALADAKAAALAKLEAAAKDSDSAEVQKLLESYKEQVNNATSAAAATAAGNNGTSAINNQINSEKPSDNFFVVLFTGIGKLLDMIFGLFKW